MRNIDLIRQVKQQATGRWQGILASLGAEVPLNRHTACPACGGKDRFRFDDKEGNGTFICNQCGSGDGLDLVRRLFNVDVTEAAKEVAKVISIPVQKETTISDKPPLTDAIKKSAKLLEEATLGQSQYLILKGHTCSVKLLKDGSMILPVKQGDKLLGAQIIRANGEKRFISGTKKKGGYIPVVDFTGTPDTVLIAEGYATALTVSQLHEGVVLAALDEGNLLPVATWVRKHYPQSKIIIAADNDVKPDEANIGKIKAEKTAKVVNGWVTIPPTKEKADWDDYRQQHGIEAAKQAFIEGAYQVEFDEVTDFDPYELGSGEVITANELALLQKMNGIYTHVTIGGKHRVVTLKPCQVNGLMHTFEELAQFKNYFLHEGRIAKKLSLGDAWLKWKGKNYKPNGVGFYPEPSKCPDTVYNLYMGLSVKPVEGDCSLYLNHIRHIICSGDEIAYQYVIAWMAHLIQKPDEKPSVAIAMKSVRGAGKGTFVKPLLQILGQYGVQVNGAEHLTAKFNAMLANKLLVFADEATVASAKDGEKLNGIISESTFNLERKGIDPEPMANFSRLIFASNSTQALKAGIKERRYLVLEPDGSRAQDKSYFDNLYQWVNDKGAAKLLYYLQHYDISGFDRHRAPKTEALKEEILFGLTGLYAYLYAELSKDEPFDRKVRIPVTELIDNYLFWCKSNGEPETEAAARSRVGKTMIRMGLNKLGRRGCGIGIVYELPSVDELRIRFADMIGMELKDVF
ncbi:primase-helicase zinc-binding domain-containing protein [Arsenophonus nasoniae]|uniref:DNA primase TraC n=2 Tax=Arsenophonus nasoniae TaxID=638 RepID=A0A4P7KUB6_9GAMM|nr:DUF5906 domain-containing protein [Arsenophonus nasoniae]QBY43665.1 DNA primase TraC [Arsenophonus nasoniae]WGM04723.1 primase-helicase zinc-binding domain-containing protein [Arsenophonus nasoniae]WGM04982.1 primase-helicase zinc-binding domain-containing protein [Arsenophonus nasoniae]WGM06870.1 primase-helicase zinc-binding domain-containing protein [Arsenophonus nasoniae]WGM07454.1 primase-helicase zinc-binding domain-containing protein [Arsenophonus nasoniae]